jgi:gliding-associated putative ABC transporter substrate-binding component GldG
MVTWKSKKLGDLLKLANGLCFLLLLNILSQAWFFRVDMTQEERYSIQAPSRELLSSLEDVVYVEVFLEGDLNASLRRLRNAIGETLEVFDSYAVRGVQFRFTDPATAQSKKAQSEFAQELAAKGIQMLPVVETRDGQRVEKVVFPGALISYQGMETAVMLFKHNQARNYQEVVNQSIEGLEYELASAIQRLSTVERKRIGFLTGHGELSEQETASLRSALIDRYDVIDITLAGHLNPLDCQVLVIAKPAAKFSEQEKYFLDQYILNGGRVLVGLDQMDASMDSASRENYFAFPLETGLMDQLFRYGARVNLDLVQDRVAARYPVVTGMVDNKPQMMQAEWPFFPLINQYGQHPTTRNLDAVMTRFISSIDTVRADGVRKTPLMMTSPYARRTGAPVKVSINDLRRNVDPSSFAEGPIPVAYLLEGSFTSLYRNRFAPQGIDTTGFKRVGVPSKIIVIGDGDLFRNDINPRNRKPQQLGLDPFSGYVFANQDLLLNMVSFLADENGLITARNREIRLRPLNKEKIRVERARWQLINIGVPLLFLLAFGVARRYWRARRYAHYG